MGEREMMNVAVKRTHVHEAHEGLALCSISRPITPPPSPEYLTAALLLDPP